MSQGSKRVLVVHDNEGLPLAIMLAEEHTTGKGLRTGARPLLREGQQIAEIELDHEQQQLRLDELLQYRVSYAERKATLGRRVLE
jgi:hypothetical protein